MGECQCVLCYGRKDIFDRVGHAPTVDDKSIRFFREWESVLEMS